MSEGEGERIEVQTRLFPATPDGISEAAVVVRRGGLVAFPTDTVYGVGADAFQPAAVERIYWAKGRPESKAIPLLLGKTEDLSLAAEHVPAAAWTLVERFWPGALTLVLRARADLPAAVTAGTGTVAVRLPNHPVALQLIQSVGVPLAATSANRSGQPNAVTAEEVQRELGGRVDVIIDGGRCPGGVPSTVLDLTQAAPRLLRRGAIATEDVERVLGRAIEK